MLLSPSSVVEAETINLHPDEDGKRLGILVKTSKGENLLVGINPHQMRLLMSYMNAALGDFPDIDAWQPFRPDE